MPVLLVLAAALPARSLAAALQMIDDSGRQVSLMTPARRIISLAPNITELLYAAGAGRYIVGTISYSDYPPEARQIPRIGDYTGLDMEAIIGLQPDLIIAWPSGNQQSQLQKLRDLGLTLYSVEPHRLDDIPLTIDRLGQLAGTTGPAHSSATDFRQRLQSLRRQYQGLSPVRVFFQIWEQPLLTVNGQHLISDAIHVCGGENIFAGLPALTPQVSIEAVLQANPQAIITSADDTTTASNGQPASLQHWRTWNNLDAGRNGHQRIRLDHAHARLADAGRNGHLYGIDPEQISRHTPRILTGVKQLCEDLQQVRLQPGT